MDINQPYCHLNYVMKDFEILLTEKFPEPEVPVKGQLVFLGSYDDISDECPELQKLTQLSYLKAKFFTGFRNAPFIPAIVGVSEDSQVFILTNPLFSDWYCTLIGEFAKIDAAGVDDAVLSEILYLIRETGTAMWKISRTKYHVGVGEIQWGVLDFEINGTLKIYTRSFHGLSGVMEKRRGRIAEMLS
ncbi:hypothetical protein FPE01S_05_00780 [Flavihumibacter petaseus NBRC 106054]|uniref:Uncharacterized protein n=2 Tax=Flavihumibacter TaxID=1004301 RepID=A0A0E9N6R0_9BACT|nr:hypothetical protein FPE01S_05_00780 [Flavihumibacter petaseus NBRC 106054]